MGGGDLQAAKAAARTACRARLRAVPAEVLAQHAATIRGHVQQHLSTCAAGGVVALFGGIRGEVDLVPLLPWLLERGLVPALFAFDDLTMTAHAVRSAADLQRGTFDAWVPAPDAPVVPAARVDVVLVPGLAFGRDGSRLGRGRGYFDRWLSRPEVRARRIGVAFEWQCLDSVPHGQHDVRMQALVTERGFALLDAEAGPNSGQHHAPR